MKAAESRTMAKPVKRNTSFFSKDAADGFFKTGQQNKGAFFKTTDGSHPIQTKLSIGKVDDPLEHEADAMADKVVRRFGEPNRINTKPENKVSAPSSIIQTKCASCEREDKLQKKDKEENEDLLKNAVQKKPIFESNTETPLLPINEDQIHKKCADCGIEEKLQKKSEGSNSQIASPDIESTLNASKGSGSPLQADIRNNMESAIGADFNHVRIHNNSNAIQMSRELNAQAFTHGHDIYFNSNKYDTTQKSGQHLLAHELTHVVQQNNQIRKSPQVLKTENHADFIQRSCGPSEIATKAGTHAGCTDNFDNTFVSGSTFRFDINCDQFAAGQKNAIISFVKGLPATTKIEIHGYASSDGPVDFNKNLGCARVLKAQSVITDPLPAGAGIPVARISKTVNHGPVPGLAADRRTVVIQTTAAPVPVPPIPVNILGGTELWDFGGEAPPGYPLKQTLTANAAGRPGNFTWTIINGAGFAVFDAPGLPVGLPFAFGPSVTIKSISPSVALNDIQVRVDFTEATGRKGFKIQNFTVLTPKSLTPTANANTAVPRGYQSLIGYSIQDQFNTTLPRNIEINEQWDEKPAKPDFPFTNWPTFPPVEGHSFVSPAGWSDNVSIADVVPPVLIPAPTNPLTPLGPLLVQHFKGHWQVGSPTIGKGKKVRTITWRFFSDHGDHLFISTP